MTGMWSFSIGVLLFTLLPVYLNAVTLTFTSKPGLLNYVKLGDTLRLDVSYDFDGTTDVIVAWEFGTVEKVKKVGNGGVQSLDSRATIEGEASLVLKNTILKDNITFTVKISSLGVTAIGSSFQVIITVRPTAKASCSGEGDAASCLCEGKGGNPPAKTTWLKGNTKIKGPQDLSTTMDKDDIISNKEGVYTCKANSANLTHEANVTLTKPNEISFKADNGKTKLVCKVVGTITLVPVYLISLNGSEANEYKNGEKDIKSGSVGLYKCLAKNILGNATKYYFLNGTVGTDGEGDSGGLGTGAIVGIVVGVLFLIVVVVALVYWFCIKQNECCCACCVLGGKDDRSEDDRSQNENPAGGYVREDNPYASVDEERERPDKGASTSRNQARPAAEMPPVYAAVDKTKKNKKPPPDAQPALTYASLDPVILQPDSSKMRDRSREETNYAAIDLEKLQSDLV